MENRWEGGAWEEEGIKMGLSVQKLHSARQRDREKQIAWGKMRLRNSEGVKAGLLLTEPTGSESVSENWRQIETVREI